MSRDVCGFVLDDGPILVTGAGGFVGKRLMELFALGEGDYAADISTMFSVPDGVTKINWQLPGKPSSALGEVRYVIHLGGLSSVAHSQGNAELFKKVNTDGTASVINWIKKYSPEALLLFISSAEVYKPSKINLTEESPIEPRNIYAESKYAAEKLLKDSDIKWIVSRSFPHFGPGQSGNFVLPSFCRRIINSIETGTHEMVTGNLSPVRDYLYIDDVVRAYAALLSNGKSEEIYNVCSGKGNSIKRLLDYLLEVSGTELTLVTDPKLLRQKDQFCQLGDSSKLAGLGWTPQFSIKDGISELYHWWKERL